MSNPWILALVGTHVGALLLGVRIGTANYRPLIAEARESGSAERAELRARLQRIEAAARGVLLRGGRLAHQDPPVQALLAAIFPPTPDARRDDDVA